MILLAIVLGLLFQSLAQPRWFGDVTRVWLRYCEVFATWYWFMQQSVFLQSLVLCMPVVLASLILGVLFGGLLWGLVGLFLLWAGFVLSADGYRFAQLLAQWEVAKLSGVASPAADQTVERQGASVQSLILDHANAPAWEKITVGTPIYYERVYGHPGALNAQGEAEAVILTALVGLNLFLFVPLFWFVWFGPVGSLLISLGQAVAASRDMPVPLRSHIARVLEWVSWLPVRAFGLTLFFVLREHSVPVSRWWALVKSREHGVEQVLRITLNLVCEACAPSLQNPGTSSGHFPVRCYYPVCQKILWLWVGAIAFLTLVL